MRRAAWQRAALSLALPLGLACAPRVDSPPVPEGVAWLAWIETEEATVVESTPLLPYEAARPFALYAEPAPERFLVGFTEDTLAPVTARVDPATFARAPLSAPAMCAPTLPAADWWVGFSAGGTPIEGAPDPAPALTAPWLVEACPAAEPEDLLLEISCLPAPCLQAVLPTGTCSAELDLAACGLTSIELVRDPFGGACAIVPPEWACAPLADPPPDAAVGLSCRLPLVDGDRTCRVVAYVRAEASALALDEVVVDRRTVVEDPQVELPSVLERFSHINPEDAFRSVAFGLAIDAEGAPWVSTVEGRDEVDCTTPRSPRAGRLQRFDPASLERVGSSTAPPCLQALLPDPEPTRGRLLGLHVEDDGWAVSRFDAQGRVIATERLPDSGPTRDVWTAGLLHAPARASDAGLVVALSRTTPERRVDLYELSATDLSVVRRRAVEAVTTYRVTLGPDGRLRAGLSGADRWLARLDLDEPGRDVLVPLERPLLRDNVAFMDVVAHGDVDAYALSRDMTSVRIHDGVEQVSTTYFERATQAVRLGPWPADPTRLAHVGLSRTPDSRWEALLYLVDPARRRLLPGHVVIGEGVATEMRADANGWLWVLLGWSGELVRVALPTR